jgi:eukaryotic-like serine/threonine-protein kinase
MGMVYEAETEGTGEHVALKVIHRHLLSNVQVTKRFVREASIVQKLAGEHLVRLVHHGEDESGRLYMALELVDGDALDRVIAVRGQMSIEAAVDVVIQVCSALESAHREGVVHRDLKPANILLEQRGSETRVRVCDFGLAKALREPGTATTALTDQNMVFGTPEYMSPEQVRGEDLDARADIYATGVLLYELLTGTPPFQGKTSVLTMTSHITDVPPPLTERAPGRAISRALEAVALHALAKDPDERYGTAAAMRDALRSALASPDDVEAVRPAAALARCDTHLALTPAKRQAVDPLGPTAQLPVKAVVRPPASPSIRPSAPPSSGSGPVTPEGLGRGRSGAPAWLWIAVALLAAGAGVWFGVLTAGR